ncbi:unnamed protein product [Ixodes pacificus]
MWHKKIHTPCCNCGSLLKSIFIICKHYTGPEKKSYCTWSLLDIGIVASRYT